MVYIDYHSFQIDIEQNKTGNRITPRYSIMNYDNRFDKKK